MPKLTRELKTLLDKENEATKRYVMALILFDRAKELDMPIEVLLQFSRVVHRRLKESEAALAEVIAYAPPA